jgi:hypothetical protein
LAYTTSYCKGIFVEAFDGGHHCAAKQGCEIITHFQFSLLLNLLIGGFAHGDRELPHYIHSGITKRTSEGRAVAQEAGVKFGRKRTWTDAQAITVREMRDQGLGYGSIATKLNISVSKVRRILGLI